jgi:tRNA dimethylallyltransferase
LALRLARWSTRRGRPAEIINADSMQVYRGMDIGTAKPTPAQQAEIPHHLIDGLELDQTASVADFQRLARQAIADCHRRGVRPIVVGGSALYLRAITDRFEFPPQDPVRRSELEAELAAVGPAVLYQRLERLDPQAAAGILPGNGRRIVRALEAIAVTGAFRSQLPPFEFALPRVRLVGLAWPRPQLDERIEQRVKAMWADGLLTEVAGLLERGLRQAPTAAKAIGYAQAIACLDGDLTPAEAQQAIVTKTRQFARKQLAWWRRDPRIVWCAAEPLLRHDVAGQGGPDFLTAD